MLLVMPREGCLRVGTHVGLVVRSSCSNVSHYFEIQSHYFEILSHYFEKVCQNESFFFITFVEMDFPINTH